MNPHYPHRVDSTGALLSGILTVVAVIVLVVFTVGFIVYNRRLRGATNGVRIDPSILDHGVDLTDPDQRAHWLASGVAGASVKERLRTIEALRSEGLISQAEWELTRQDILHNL